MRISDPELSVILKVLPDPNYLNEKHLSHDEVKIYNDLLRRMQAIQEINIKIKELEDKKQNLLKEML